jgi:hypothetical protein
MAEAAAAPGHCREQQCRHAEHRNAVREERKHERAFEKAGRTIESAFATHAD